MSDMSQEVGNAVRSGLIEIIVNYAISNGMTFNSVGESMEGVREIFLESATVPKPTTPVREERQSKKAKVSVNDKGELEFESELRPYQKAQEYAPSDYREV